MFRIGTDGDQTDSDSSSSSDSSLSSGESNPSRPSGPGLDPGAGGRGGSDDESSRGSSSGGDRRLENAADRQRDDSGGGSSSRSSSSSSSSSSSRGSSSSSSSGGVIDGVENTVDKVADEAGDVVDDVTDTGREATDAVGGAADDAARTARETADTVGRQAGQTARRGQRTARRAVRRADRAVDRSADRGREAVTDVSREVDRAVDPAREVAVGAAAETAETAADTADDATEVARDTVTDAERTARDTAGDAERTIRETAEKAREAGSTAVDAEERTAEDVARSAGDVAGSSEQDDGGASSSDGALDTDRLLNTTSPGSQLFGTKEREEAIEAAAQEGSPSGRLFVAAESFEAAGSDVSAELDQAVPKLDESTKVPVVLPGAGVVDVEANPQAAFEGNARVGEQLRNVPVGAPAGAGVLAGLGPRAVADVGLRLEAAAGRDIDSEAMPTAAESVQGVERAGATVAEGVRREPVGATAELFLPTAASRASPVRVRRFDVPKQPDSEASVSRARRAGAAAEAARRGESPSAARDLDLKATPNRPTETVAGVRLEKPAVVQAVTGPSRGRTVVGFKGVRPRAGAPTPDTANIDLKRVGREGFGSFEPTDPFETDVMRAAAREQGSDAAKRAEAVESVIDETRRQPQGAEIGRTEDVVDNVRSVPDRRVGEVSEALRDTDAAIFGSAAVRSQLSDFRQPRDIDVVVPDESAARQRFGNALEGSNADVGDVFDIKGPSDAPGRATGGERIKFGEESRAPLETEDGVRVNPVEEELTRKAGASGIFREPGAAGTQEFDVGPEPRRPGRSDVRQKDVDDTQAIGREVLGPDSEALREFETAFGLREQPAPATAPAAGAGVGEPGQLADLLADTRGQVGAGRRRADASADTDADSATRSRPRDGNSRTDSPGRERSPDGSQSSSSPRLRSSGLVLSASPAVGGTPDDTSPAGGGSPGEGDGGALSPPGGPGDNVSPPGAPPGPPTSPPGMPPGPPTTPPRTPPGPPTTPPSRPPRRREDDTRDEPEEQFPTTAPFETPFRNPIASGGSVLFGTVGAASGAAPETAASDPLIDAPELDSGRSDRLFGR